MLPVEDENNIIKVYVISTPNSKDNREVWKENKIIDIFKMIDPQIIIISTNNLLLNKLNKKKFSLLFKNIDSFFIM
jgi:hypothetical protein